VFAFQENIKTRKYSLRAWRKATGKKYYTEVRYKICLCLKIVNIYYNITMFKHFQRVLCNNNKNNNNNNSNNPNNNNKNNNNNKKK